jgi:Calcineurin-like phosphoesterase
VSTPVTVATPIVNYATIVAHLGPEESVGDERLLADGEDPVAQAQLHAALAHVELVLKQETRDADVFVSPSDALTARFQSFVATHARATGKVEPVLPGGLEVKFDRHDWLGWARHFVPSWLAGRRRHPFQALPDLEAAPDALRVALFSDWGTGLYGAPHITASINNDAAGFDYVIHLGDVYYAGSEDEFDSVFLPLWPKPKGGGIGRTLNGNHEMYSGGNGYFGVALPALGQGSSVFAIQNRDWLIVGLDSAYRDFDLARGQAEWLAGLMQGAGTRKLIVLTHHQLFSNTAHAQGVRMQTKLARLLRERRVFAWYWGHEHICALYEPHPLWGLIGRCVGHGGMPEFRHEFAGAPESELAGARFFRVPGAGANPSCLVLDGPNPFITGHESGYMPHGYVTLDFDGPHLTETLRDPTGTVLRELQLA